MTNSRNGGKCTALEMDKMKERCPGTCGMFPGVCAAVKVLRRERRLERLKKLTKPACVEAAEHARMKRENREKVRRAALEASRGGRP